jgi:hypothetical protein
MRVAWDAADARYYQTGTDRGVLYPSVGNPVAWNGITGIDENSAGESSILYMDGMIYLADVEPGDFTATLTAFFWPDEFDACLGIPEATDGFFVDSQKPKRFSLTYRSLVGSGLEGDMFGYQIHLVYNAVASLGTRSRKTLSDKPTPMEFTFDLVCTPVKLQGFRPSAHYIIDTRSLTPEAIAELEDILYGTATTAPRMPTPLELFDLMNFGDAIQVTYNVAAGTITYRGKGSNVVLTSETEYQINNVNATAPDANGQYVVSDGGNTTVTVV